MPKALLGQDELDFDVNDFTASEMIAIEKVMGQTFDRTLALLMQGSAEAFRAFVWAMRRRGNPGLRIDDVEFTRGEWEAFAVAIGEQRAKDAQAQRAAGEVVPGGRNAVMDPEDPTVAPGPSTPGV